MEIISTKAADEYTIYKAKYFLEENIFWVAELNGFFAHELQLKRRLWM